MNELKVAQLTIERYKTRNWRERVLCERVKGDKKDETPGTWWSSGSFHSSGNVAV